MPAKSIRKRTFAKDAKPPGNGVLLGYARVSKGDEQNNALQAKALRAAGCRRLFEETASGGRWDRPELHRMLDHLREGDTVVVWKLDRLSRSLKDVLHIMERIAKAGAGFRSITENIDTTTPAGPDDDADGGSFAEFERAMIRERTSAGLAAARAEGRVGGRARSSMLPNATRSPKASSPAASLAPRWRGSTTSASQPCHGSSPSTVPVQLKEAAPHGQSLVIFNQRNRSQQRQSNGRSAMVWTAGTAAADDPAILHAAIELVRQIVEAGDQIEQGRRIPLNIAQAMKEAGIFSMAMPCGVGWAGVDP